MNAPQTADPFGLVGQVLDGQFRVEKLVGEGGFSAVYRGHHLGLNEPVAIKALKLPPSLGSQLVDNFVHRFRDESRILYRLSQGNLHIVRSIAAGTTKTTTSGLVVPYMVLEWLEGRSLANDFMVRKTLGNPGRSLDELVTLFATAADALAFAHAQGVVHRDLNPGNFFLAVTPQGMKMKVLDFGVAKILDDSTLNLGPRAQTMGQIRIFAPAYGSPEQFDDGLGAVAPPSDVYAFALILMEALRDKPVNEGHNLSDFATAAVDANRRPTPKSLGLDVPDAVQRVFERATKLRPQERYPHVGEMWRAFDAAVTASRGAKKSDRPGAPARPAAGPLGRTLPLGSPHMPGIPLPSAGGPGGLKPPPGRAAGTAPLGSSAQKAAAAAAAMSKPMPAPLPKPTPSPAAIPAPPPKKAAPTPMDTAKTKVAASPAPAPGAVTAMGVGSGPSTQRFAPRPGAKAPSEPPLHGGDDDGEDEPTRVGNSPLGGAAMPSDAPLHGEPRDEVTRVHAPDADVLMAASSMAKTVMGTPPPPGQQRRPSPIPPAPPSSGGTLAIPPGGGGMPLPPPPSAFVPSAPPQQPPMPAPPPGQRLASFEHTVALGATSPFAPQPGQGSLPPYPSQPMPQPPSGSMPVTPAPGPAPASAMAPAPGMNSPGMMPGGGLPAHFAQAQQPPQFSYPTGAHPQPGFADASAVPKPQQPGAPVGLIIGAVALLIVALGGFALFVLFGRSSGASTPTVSSASAQPVASPVPAPSPTPPPIATPTETQAANEPPPPDSASAVPSNEPPPTPTTTTTTPTPTPTAATTTVATGGNTWTPPTATAVPKPTPTAAPEPVDPRAWNESAARARLSQANGAMAFCRQADNPGGAGSATVTFAPEGNVASVTLDPPYAGTKTGDCVAGQFKRAKLNPFDGSSRTLKHSFEVPK